ncbi:MAG: hypothetical protein HFF18_14175 [Oscillospiraceae bacterium]|nr:hypothetical protein [Oscillospiraceae bacterium]
METILTMEDEKLGILYGRDCIFVDSVIQTDLTLKFKGEINGNLASNIKDAIWIPYELIFKKVIKCISCELDTYEADKNEIQAMNKSSLLVIQDSDHLKNIPVRYDYNKNDYKHFIVYTYDFVYHVFAVDCELKSDLSNARKKS